MLFYAMSAEEALKKLSSQPSGLLSSVAKQREKKYGPNVIKVESEPLWKKIIEPFIDVFTLVLVTAAAISLWHGATIDAVIILVIIAVSATIFYIQRFSTDRVLRSLSRHDTQKVDVMRGGKIVNLDAAQLVPGDIVNLTEGEKVPADIRLIKAANLRVDEAQLTGESIPISKHIKPLDDKKEIYEQANMLFQGSFVVSGTGTGVITATGNATEFGNIAALSKKETAKSPVQRKIDILITKIIATVTAVAVVAFGLSLLRGMDLFDSIRFVMALAVSAVPESLPIAISVVLVLGMRRMAAKKALVHQMRAIETVGVITTIATDKTGTLTKNILTVQEVWTLNPKNDIKKVIAYFANHGDGKSHDPLDMAINTYAKRHNASMRGLPTMELPFNQDAAMSATVWHYGKNYHTYYKGAPESIMNACRVPKVEAKKITQALEELTSHGYRVVGLASSTSTEAPTDLSSLDPRTKMHFVGLIAVADVLRPEASRAIKSALAAGVSVRMITGDHFETAYQIGKKLGMVESREEVFDCRKMSDMTDEELDGIIEKTKVFSRVIPEQKFRILKILKKHNITAMTGDGVNDVPALSGADVGIAMGSGSSIAKDAGAIILLDDNCPAAPRRPRSSRRPPSPYGWCGRSPPAPAGPGTGRSRCPRPGRPSPRARPGSGASRGSAGCGTSSRPSGAKTPVVKTAPSRGRRCNRRSPARPERPGRRASSASPARRSRPGPFPTPARRAPSSARTARGRPPGKTTALCRSEERRVGKECRSRWSPYH